MYVINYVTGSVTCFSYLAVLSSYSLPSCACLIVHDPLIQSIHSSSYIFAFAFPVINTFLCRPLKAAKDIFFPA